MIICESIVKVMKERNITQAEIAKQVRISTSTISEWKKRKTYPVVDKIMDICNVLQITPEQLLTGKGIEGRKRNGIHGRLFFAAVSMQRAGRFTIFSTIQKFRT